MINARLFLAITVCLCIHAYMEGYDVKTDFIIANATRYTVNVEVEHCLNTITSKQDCKINKYTRFIHTLFHVVKPAYVNANNNMQINK